MPAPMPMMTPFGMGYTPMTGQMQFGQQYYADQFIFNTGYVLNNRGSQALPINSMIPPVGADAVINHDQYQILRQMVGN